MPLSGGVARPGQVRQPEICGIGDEKGSGYHCFYLFDKPADLGLLLDGPKAEAFYALRFE